MESSNQYCQKLCNVGLVDHCTHNYTDTELLSAGLFTGMMICGLFASIFLNVTILVVIGCNRRMQTVTNVFAVSLAVNDILLAGVADINAVLVMNGNNSSRQINVLRRVFIFFVSFVMICNHLNHMLISLERWLFIARPFQHQRLVTTKVIACSIVAVWIIPFACSVNLLVDVCVIGIGVVRLQFCAVFSSIHFSMSVVQFVIYGHIAVITRRQHRRINNNRVGGETVDLTEVDKILLGLRTSWKQVRMFVIAFGTYFLCETPWVVTNILAFSSGDENVYGSKVMRVAIILSLFQCFTNFVTRLFLDSEFRQALKQSCARSCGRCRKAHPAIIKVSPASQCRSVEAKNPPACTQDRPTELQSTPVVEAKNPPACTQDRPTELQSTPIVGAKNQPACTQDRAPELQSTTEENSENAC